MKAAKGIILSIGLLLPCLLSSALALPEKTIQNPLAWSNTDSQLFRDQSRLDSLYAAQNSTRDKAELDIQKARLYAANDYYSTAINFYRQALELLSSLPETENERIDLLIELSELYEPYGDYASGIATLYEVIKLCGENLPEKQALANIRIAFFHTQLNNVPLAKSHLSKASWLIRQIPDTAQGTIDFLQYRLNNTLANVYSSGHPDSAFLFLDLAQKYARNDIRKMQVIFQNKAVLYFYKQEYDSAEMFSRKALAITDDKYNQLSIAFNIAELEQLKGNTQKALALYRQAIPAADEIKAIPIKIQILKNMADAYAGQGNHSEAYAFLLQAQSIADSTYVSESQQKLLSVQRDFELFQNENAKRILSYQEELYHLQTFKKNILIGVISLCLIASIFCMAYLYKRFRKQQKESHRLTSSLEQKIKEENRVVQKIQNETDKKNREILTYALSSAKTGEILDSVVTELSQLRHNCKDKRNAQAIASIENKIRSINWDEDAWNSFRFYFENLHPSFFSRLSQAYPALTPGEIRICAFIAMNLSTKDIASLTNRSVRTIDTAKFHIRKKLGITKDTSLLSILLAFTNPDPETASEAKAQMPKEKPSPLSQEGLSWDILSTSLNQKPI